MMSLAGRICLVTGATRGIGKGIAVQLGEAGATVYITGRTLKRKPGSSGGSLEETAQEIERRGGQCIPVQCDHNKDADIEALFTKIKEEQNGRLDLLVNNAYAAVSAIIDSYQKKFWEVSASMWDDVNSVGLRNHYICAVHATRLMVEQGCGMIIWVSSFGGVRYLFNVAYGVGKTACDRMAADCGFELRHKNVCCISLWPGLVKTETFVEAQESNAPMLAEFRLDSNELAESPEFSGKVIVQLMQESDSQRQKRNGKVVIGADVGEQYGLADNEGCQPLSVRSFRHNLYFVGYNKIAYFLPRWLKYPAWLLTLSGHKF